MQRSILTGHTSKKPTGNSKREGGCFARLDKMFNGERQKMLETFSESIRATA